MVDMKDYSAEYNFIKNVLEDVQFQLRTILKLQLVIIF